MINKDKALEIAIDELNDVRDILTAVRDDAPMPDTTYRAEDACGPNDTEAGGVAARGLYAKVAVTDLRLRRFPNYDSVWNFKLAKGTIVDFLYYSNDSWVQIYKRGDRDTQGWTEKHNLTILSD